jgi:photosystem II stability/assembly factor-like uncharacterized protein
LFLVSSAAGAEEWQRLLTVVPGGFDGKIFVDAAQPGVTYWHTHFGTLMRTTDDGASWTTLSVPVADAYALSFQYDARFRRLYLSTTRGLFRSEDLGANWAQLPLPELGESSPLRLATAPTDPQTLYLSLSPACSPEACSRRGVLRSRDGGFHWESAGLDDFVVWSLAVAPTTPEGVYASGHNAELGGVFDARIFRTKTGGFSWDVLVPGATILREITVDPRDPLRLFCVLEVQFSRLLLRSVDGGATWTPRPFVVNGATVGVTTIELDAADPNTVYVGSLAHGVFRSRNGGDTWESVGGPLDGAVVSVDTAPDRSAVWATTSQGSVYRLRPEISPEALVAWFDFEVASATRLVAFDEQATGQPTAWQWDFGDGSTASGPSPSHTYAAQGEYRVTLVAGAGGAQHSVTRIVRIDPARRRATVR